jgi:hypothetical protein
MASRGYANAHNGPTGPSTHYIGSLRALPMNQASSYQSFPSFHHKVDYVGPEVVLLADHEFSYVEGGGLGRSLSTGISNSTLF